MSAFEMAGLVLLILLLLTIAVGSFFSCHDRKNSNKNKVAEKPNSGIAEAQPANFLTKKMADAVLQTGRLSAHANLKIRSEAQNLDASANLFWVRDSCLWVQVKKFGIEGARALVRRDSVFLINRLDQTFMAESIDFLTEKYQLPGEFGVINALVLGQPWFFPGSKIETSIENGTYKMDASDRENRFSETVFVKNDPFLLQKWAISAKNEAANPFGITSGFDDWRTGPGGLGHFSFLRTVKFGSPTTGATTVEAELSDLEIFPTKMFRFEIPSHYKRVSAGQ